MLMVIEPSKKMAPILRQVYEQMSEPRWVIAVGACASSGGILIPILFYKELIKVIPVDVYVPVVRQDQNK
jgi:NADH-quinone oxidoreductase subunit B